MKKKSSTAKKQSAISVNQQQGTRLSNTLLFWTAVFFLLFSVFAVMTYVRQVEDAKQIIWFRQQLEKQQQSQSAPTVSPSPTPKPARKK